jgi:hypothetical protein
MAIDPKININENQVIFKRDGGHKHDGLTSSLIDYTKYSIFDFPVYPVAQPGTSRRNFEDTNVQNLESFIINAVERRVLNPKGIRVQANAITANEIVSGTITAGELASNIILVNNVIKSKNYNGTVDVDGNISAYGNTGWAITHSGEAEFNNILIRGTVVSNSGTIGGWTINSNTLTAGNVTLDSAGSITSVYSNTVVTINNPDVTWPVLMESLTSTGQFGPIGMTIDNETGTTYIFADSITTTGYITTGDYIESSAVYLGLGFKNSGGGGAVAKLNQNNFLANTSSSGGGRVYVNSNNVLYNADASSVRYKENISNAEIDFDKILSIRLVEFNYKEEFLVDSQNEREIGVIAEELESLGLSKYVTYSANGLPHAVKYDKLCLSTLAICQSQQQKIEELESRLQALEGV